MNPSLVFFKTAAGDEAMRVQTKVMQRNVRTVLILVDGRTSVTELCAKTGNPRMTENALLDLERGGFIATVGNVSPAFESFATEVTSSANEIEIPVLQDIVKSDESRNDSPLDVAWTMDAVTPATKVESHRSQSLFSDEPAPIGVALKEKETGSRAQRGEKTTLFDEPRPQFLSIVQRFRAWRMAHGQQAGVSDAVIRRPRREIGWKSFFAWAGLCVAVLLALAAVVFPFSIFRPDIEATLTQAIGRPVQVGEIEVSFYPRPGIVLRQVSVNVGASVKGDNVGPALSIPEILLEPAVTTMFSAVKEFRGAVVREATLPLESLTLLPVLLERLRNPASSVRLANLRLEAITLEFAGLPLRGIAGTVDFSQGGSHAQVDLRTADRSLILSAVPVGQRVEITLEGLGIRLPSSVPVVIDSIAARGALEQGVLSLKSIEVRTLDGLIQGDALIQTSKKISIAGNLKFERVNTERLFGALGMNALLLGEVAGRLRYSATINDWSDVFSAMLLDGDFAMQRGSLRGVDLVEAIRRGSGAPVQGGVTNFEQMTGKIRVGAKGTRVSGLVMESGLIRSNGSLEVNEHQDIEGRVDLQMRGSVNQTRVPIALGGNLKAPSAQAGGR